MINFAVGPVQSDNNIRAIGSEQIPYFRTQEFSNTMLENEQLMLKFSNAPTGSRVIFITGSGTASMEASVINTLSKNDKAIVINGGSFGARFAEILRIHGIPFSEIKLDTGKALSAELLEPFSGKGYTALLINMHETSTGVLYDMDMVGRFCKENGLFLIVDAISSFLADEFDMKKFGADVMITGSQKALACPPGISIIVLSQNALARIEKNDSGCLYLDLKSALFNMNRGQTPFTPAVGILMQINARLKQIEDNGGVISEINRISELANYFRNAIKNLPFDFVSESMSNALTSLHPRSISANALFEILKDQYGIWICPNGGKLKDTVFRVGHIGDLSFSDFDTLISAFNDLQQKGII